MTWTSRHPALTYTGARLLLFGVLFGVLLILVGDLFISLITAAIVSSVLSIFLLRRQRDALSASIASRASRANEKMAERAASEDAWDDAQRGVADSDPGRL